MKLTLEEAVSRVRSGVKPLPCERVSLDDSLNRVLARDVFAQVDVPPWNNSSMDGYAVRREDVLRASESSPVTLRVRETVVAGSEPADALRFGEAVRIMTGAPVPPGCDTVIRIEDTDGGEREVSVRSSRDAGRNVRARGEDLREGSVSVRAGTRLRPAHLGLLAASGAAVVQVHRRPRVLLLCSGDELVELDRFQSALAGHRMVSTNGYALRALAREAGAEVVDGGIVPDSHAAWQRALTEADIYDLVVTTGGASVGAFDFAKEAAERRGAEIAFRQVRVRPASRTAFGRLAERTSWLVLPGNPVSAMVGFEIFALPLLRMLAGDPRPYVQPVPAELGETAVTPGSDVYLLRVTLEPGTARSLPVARLTGAQGTGVLSSMAAAHGLLVVPEGTTMLEAGSAASVLPLHHGLRAERFSMAASID